MTTSLATTIVCDLRADPKLVYRMSNRIAGMVGDIELLRVSRSDQLLLIFHSVSVSAESVKRKRVLTALKKVNPRVLSIQWMSKGKTQK